MVMVHVIITMEITMKVNGVMEFVMVKVLPTFKMETYMKENLIMTVKVVMVLIQIKLKESSNVVCG